MDVEDIVSRILLKLPVKSLLICRAVCKDWRRLISSPYFIRLHLNKSKENPSFIASLIRRKNPDVIGFDVDIFGQKIPLLPDCREYLHLICCFNGLICWRDSLWPRKKMYISNPATREILLLPEPPRNPLGQYGIAVAFLGPDDHTSQCYYKVYAFPYCAYSMYKRTVEYQFEVYCSRTKSWKVIGHVRQPPLLSRQHICVNGTVYWLCTSGTESETQDDQRIPPYILAIDWDQNFIRISLPEFSRQAAPPICHNILLVEFEGCLSLIDAFYDSFDLWVLKDGNNDESSSSSSSTSTASWVKRCSATFPFKACVHVTSVAARGNEIIFQFVSYSWTCPAEKERRSVVYGVDSKTWDKVNWLDDIRVDDNYPTVFAFSESLLPCD